MTSSKLYCFSLLLTGFWCAQQPVAAQRPSATLFESDAVLDLKLSGNIRALFDDRGDDSKYRNLVLSYKNSDSSETSLAIKAKTRGHFRKDKSNCTYPPVLLNFQGSEKKATLFENQQKLKLVTSCRGDKYVIREYLVYKLYNLVTPKSFRARLVRPTFYDTIRKKQTSFYGILLEEADQVAKRNGVSILDVRRVHGPSTELETFLKMAVFQYMIGNTDWSVEYLHNIKAIAFDSLTIASVIPYDFDHAGIVDAPYAQPAPQLELASVRDRRYRGYCIADLALFKETIAAFNRLKSDFYAVYTSCPLLDEKYISTTLKFLDAFYEVINNPKKLKAEFTYPCSNTTSKIVIGGLGTTGTED
jgi:hypothetical protein